MVNNKKELKILKYEESQMKEVLQAVKNGMALAEASRTFNVLRTTLTYKFSGRYPEKRKMGPATYISEENEEMLINWITESQKKGFPISCIQLSERVKKLVTELNIHSHDQMKEVLQAVKNGMALAEASRTFNVLRTTLTYKFSGRYPEKRKIGPATYISEENEEMLIN
ncbi:hypothetical protein PR048_011800 [Dryococelus australis]|uniref:HTH psq-type domain-containing protein n=1 Tax=Dryococelus australis TaxID=614101 RepID=A0ABQ9HMP3_9NEOP|nr:hypothetical protein PR048_011800 [Dryococelus australis]